MKRTAAEVAPLIDASIGAKPAPTLQEVEQFVRATVPLHFAVTLAEPYYIKRAAEILHPAAGKVCTVLSYPLAGMTRESKLFQIKQALVDGADELDVSMNLSAFLSGHEEEAKDEMEACFALIKGQGKLMKMIYFADYLSREQQKRAASIAIELQIPFLKTNTGFGAVTTAEQVSLIKETFGGQIKVMASGGIRSRADAERMLDAGADRIATSSALKIMAEYAAGGEVAQ